MTMALRGYRASSARETLCRVGLERAVPIIPQWRLSALPRHIGAADVNRLIATCDPGHAGGRSRSSHSAPAGPPWLAAGDILALRLHDIDWQHATLTVRGKGRR